MASSNRGLPSGKNPSSALPFWNRLHRYRCLLLKYWWIVALTLSLAVCAAAAYEMTRPVVYGSEATLNMNVPNRAASLSGNGGAEQGSGPFTQDLDGYVESEIAVMKSPNVTQLTAQKMQAQYPRESDSPVMLDFTARNNLVTVDATGTDAVHTQHYLEQRIQGYLMYRKNMRGGNTEETRQNINEQIENVDKDLKADDDAIIAFQRANNVVLGDGDVPTGTTNLASLQQKLATLNDEYDQLQAMTPEQGFAITPRLRDSPNLNNDSSNSAQARAGLEASPAEADYRQAQADIVRLNALVSDFSADMRPQHPRMVDWNSQIERDKKLIASLLQENRTRIQDRLLLVESRIKTTKDDIKAAEPQALNTDLLHAQLNMLKDKKQRDLKAYDGLQTAMQNAGLSVKIDLDNVQFTGHASPPEAVPSGWVKAMAVAIAAGLMAGVGILLLIDRMDDRMGSISDFQQHFAEHVIGQIPRDHVTGNTELLRADDDRHMLVESFRNLRSTLLFMPLEGQRPKTLLITSAIPNEGKSTVSSNLALVLAYAGMKTLLIDADLRRGAVHQAFGVTRDPGLTDVLRHGVPWETAVRTTKVENLHVLPRGRNVPQPSEYLLDRATDRLLQDLYSEYDYIIIDSSPILAADDTASLAPKIDATLFVVRLSFTSAKMTRKSLEILYNRQANIPGLILNQVDTSSPEFVYYQYSEYYQTATDEEPADSLAKVKAVAKAS